jgi:hypothetical protein
MISLSLLVHYKKIIDATIRGINEWKEAEVGGCRYFRKIRKTGDVKMHWKTLRSLNNPYLCISTFNL